MSMRPNAHFETKEEASGYVFTMAVETDSKYFWSIIPNRARTGFIAYKTFDKERPLSWSAISSFEYESARSLPPEQWYRKYVLGIKDRETPEMRFGKVFAESCERRKPLAPVTLLNKMEHEFQCFVSYSDGVKIPLIGFADSFCDITFRKLREYKTGATKWTQKRADDHGQFDMYLLMNYILNKVKPEEVHCVLEWVQTQKKEKHNGDFNGDDYEISFVEPVLPLQFATERTMVDLIKFRLRVRKVYQEMEEYCKYHI